MQRDCSQRQLDFHIAGRLNAWLVLQPLQERIGFR
jgi:hypothetical protein